MLLQLVITYDVGGTAVATLSPNAVPPKVALSDTNHVIETVDRSTLAYSAPVQRTYTRSNIAC